MLQELKVRGIKPTNTTYGLAMEVFFISRQISVFSCTKVNFALISVGLWYFFFTVSRQKC